MYDNQAKMPGADCMNPACSRTCQRKGHPTADGRAEMGSHAALSRDRIASSPMPPMAKITALRDQVLMGGR